MTSPRLFGMTLALLAVGGAVGSTPPSVPPGPRRQSTSARPSRAGRSRRSGGATLSGRAVLVIGVIHGDEQAGLDIVERLRDVARPGRHRPVARRLDEPRRRRPRRAAQRQRGRPQPQLPVQLGADRRARQLGVRRAERGQRARDAGDGRCSSANCVPTSWSGTTRTLYMIAPADGPRRAVRARYAELTGLPMEKRHRRHLHRRRRAVGAQRAGLERGRARGGVHRRAGRDVAARGSRHARRGGPHDPRRRALRRAIFQS